MEMSGDMIDASQIFFSPDFVQKISDITGQSVDKTMTGLQSVVPEFVSAIIDKGATPEGAATLVDIVNTHNFESYIIPDESKLSEGNDVINNVYGNNLNNIVSRLATSTGLS